MRKKALIVSVPLLVLFILWGRVFYLAGSHYLEAERLYKASDIKLAAREYETAMHFYAPLSPFAERSAQRLWGIAGTFEKSGELQKALAAYSSIRGSFYATRSFFTPGRDWIARCDDKITAISVELLVAEGAVRPEDAAGEREKYGKLLAADRAPSVPWTLLAALGFIGWVGSTIFVIYRGFGADGKVVGRKFLYGLTAALLSFGLWLLSLYMA